jgi:hypothetical protein
MQRRARPPNPPGWTTAVGLGSDHQHKRTDALQLLRSGVDRCPRCRKPMYRWQALDLGDYPARIICDLIFARTGRRIIPAKRLEHASCNREAGSQLGTALRRAGIRRARPGQRRVTLQRTSRW